MSVDYALLRTFAELGDSPNFGAVAARLQLTPTAVAQHVRQLEAQLGVALLERVGGKLRLSEAGQSLLPVLQTHLSPIEERMRTLLDTKEQLRGAVSIAAPSALARSWLRPRLLRLLEIHRELTVKVALDAAPAVQRALLEGRCELALLVDDPQLVALEVMPVHSEELLAVASPRYLASAGRIASVQEFRAQRYLVYDESMPLHAQWWRATFGGREPFDAQVVAQIDSLEELHALCCAGLGIAVLPDHLVSESVQSGGLLALHPERQRPEPSPRSNVYLAWRRHHDTPRLRAVRALLLTPV